MLGVLRCKHLAPMGLILITIVSKMIVIRHIKHVKLYLFLEKLSYVCNTIKFDFVIAVLKVRYCSWYRCGGRNKSLHSSFIVQIIFFAPSVEISKQIKSVFFLEIAAQQSDFRCRINRSTDRGSSTKIAQYSLI